MNLTCLLDDCCPRDHQHVYRYIHTCLHIYPFLPKQCETYVDECSRLTGERDFIFGLVRKIISLEMATSESDADFESADEEMGRGASTRRDNRAVYWPSPSTVDSESDDDTEYVQRTPYRQSDWQSRPEPFITAASPDVARGRGTSAISDKHDDKIDSDVKVERDVRAVKSVDCAEKSSSSQKDSSSPVESAKLPLPTSTASSKDESTESVVGSSESVKPNDAVSRVAAAKPTKSLRSKQRDSPHQLGAKKLGSKIRKDNVGESRVRDSVGIEQTDECLAPSLHKELLESAKKDMECRSQEKSKNKLADKQSESSPTKDLSEMDMPEELKSDKKFKEIFQPEGWEGLGSDIELPDELTEEKLQTVMERLSLTNKEPEGSLGSWGSWGNWGVTSIINTATASVSTLTSHVSQGLMLLEGTMGLQDPEEEPITTEQDEAVTPDDGGDSKPIQEQDNQSYNTFGFGNLMSGVSSITKLVESTSNKVMTGGLDTLEAIGKKTMEVLQEGDPGLKKKRAFFMNEPEKPILSQILREAKEKAEAEEKTMEERELARKIHFESLFDDYQGLVHLEALEMLSKQCNMKIQQHLIALDANEFTSVQETLDEIKELCDLGDEEEKGSDKNFKDRLMEPCHDLGVDITYEKLNDVWTEIETYLATTHTDQEIFQKAISTLAQFTALSVERFHKTAELLLIKERRSTVNEADALVQLTNILSDQINSLASSFCNTLNKLAETAEKPDNINANITTIFLEAANANSYVQDAFRLLISILQVGAI
ncbi:protein FAM114A2 isoform X2 [Ooceraea biroi]|uniref:protein FAM114A2 isoform X2 n=1 Tax=Ooceraea biroi TaxID=2015173 RepID=UPI000F07659A|nr:protein FAM114A2 isoform X2 [Ooceraea biroi]